MPYVCPRCGGNDFTAEAGIAVHWDGQDSTDEFPVEELLSRIRCDMVVLLNNSFVRCNNEECEWSGTVKELVLREE